MAYHLNAVGQVVQNDVFWKDTDGNPIYSQGGGVLKVGNTYYWYGAKYNGAVTYYNNPGAGKNSDYSFAAITCYSSTDLANWKFEGNVIIPSDLPYTSWVGRIGVAYNSNTDKYVLLSQLGGGLMFATSDTPSGHFTFSHTQSSIENVVNDMSGDQSVYTDDDGQTYLILCNREGRSHQYVVRLRPSDYLHVETATEIFHSRSGGREGNIMFKHNGTYYYCSSDLHGWNSSHTYCITSTNILGPYSSEFVMEGTDADFSHVTQTGLAVEVNGSLGSFVIFGGDRWSDFAGNGIGYNQWIPVTFNGTTPVFHSLSQWNINANEGTWSVGNGNNYVLNPSFEADRISLNNLAGWTNWKNLSSDPNSNQSGGHTGRWAMSQNSSSDYQASMYQNISLPNGTYTLSAWVKSSGGQNTANIFAWNFGGNEMDYSINNSISSWTKISSPNINVTDGSIQVGVYSDANAENWVNLDDFSLVQTDSVLNFMNASITDNNPKQIQVELSKAINDSIYFNGFTVKIDDMGATIDSVVIAGNDELVINLSDSIRKDNEIKLSYSNGNVVSIYNRNLEHFNDTLVDNLLEGSPPRIIEVITNKKGDSLMIKFNKKMKIPSDISALSLNTEYNGQMNIPILPGSFFNNDSTIFTLPLNDTVYKEYTLLVTYSDSNIISADSGLLKTVSDFPVNNYSDGLPIHIYSANIGADGTSFLLKFSKPLLIQSVQSDYFTFYQNGKPVKLTSFYVADSTIKFILSKSVHYGDTLKISYSPGVVKAPDNGLLEAFSDFTIDNNSIPPAWVGIPAKIEAENYSSQRGIQTEETEDTGGGLNVGYFDKGDWLEYPIENNTSNTSYQITFRVAAPGSGAVISFYIDDKYAGTVIIPVTGDLQVYESVDENISISQGKHYLKIVATSAGFNLNYMDIHEVRTGIGKVAGAELNVYPNPASGEITISSGAFRHNKIEIFDTKGNLLISNATSGEPVLQVPFHLVDGMYFVKISSETQYQMKKIVISNK